MSENCSVHTTKKKGLYDSRSLLTSFNADRKLPRIVSSAVADGYVKDTLSTQKSTASDYVFASQELDLETTEDTSTTFAFGDSMESIVLECASPAVSSMALADCTFNAYSKTAFEHNMKTWINNGFL